VIAVADRSGGCPAVNVWDRSGGRCGTPDARRRARLSQKCLNLKIDHHLVFMAGVQSKASLDFDKLMKKLEVNDCGISSTEIKMDDKEQSSTRNFGSSSQRAISTPVSLKEQRGFCGESNAISSPVFSE
jgi:hypothetical protein